MPVPRADIGFTEAFHEQEIYILHAGERIIHVIYCVTDTICSVTRTDECGPTETRSNVSAKVLNASP